MLSKPLTNVAAIVLVIWVLVTPAQEGWGWVIIGVFETEVECEVNRYDRLFPPSWHTLCASVGKPSENGK